MEKIETLLKLDMGNAFDTRKTLNRSEKTVPPAILQEIGAGKFTCEMIQDLCKTYPVFRYQTQITIHGSFDNVTRSYIGRYKNIFQNQNGSLGIKYSAIDTAKIATIREVLRSVPCSFHYLENSNTRLFRQSEMITKDNMVELKDKYKAIAERIKTVKIYGHINVYITPTPYGAYFINCDVHPLAVPGVELMNFCHAIVGVKDAAEFKALWEIAEAAREVTRQENERANIEHQAAARQAKERKDAFLAPYIAMLGPLTPLTMDNIVVKHSTQEVDGAYKFIEYCFYRIAGKGSFGKIKVEVCRQPGLDLINAVWQEHKQVKLAELKIQGLLLPNSARQTPAKVEVRQPAIKPATPQAAIKTGNLILVEYSPAAIAVFGDTRPVKDKLMQIGGRYNAHLKHNGQQTPGYIFSNKHRPAIQAAFNL